MRVFLWALFALGLAIVAYWGAIFALIYFQMRRFGGIPYSWNLLTLNWGWTLLLVFGLALIGTTLPLLLRRGPFAR